MSGFFPTYRRTGSPLHATRASVAAGFVLAPCALVLIHDHPLVLVSALVAIIAAGLAAGVGAELARAARLALPIALLVALVNPLVSQEGLTVLVQGWTVPVLGRLDITLEAVVYGALTGLRVMVLMLAFGLYSATVNPDEILRLFGRLSLRSSLTATLATRLVPVIGRDADRLADAYLLRAERPAAGRRFVRLRRAAILTRALTAGALERAVELAAALEVRGYAATPGRRRSAPAGAVVLPRLRLLRERARARDPGARRSDGRHCDVRSVSDAAGGFQSGSRSLCALDGRAGSPAVLDRGALARAHCAPRHRAGARGRTASPGGRVPEVQLECRGLGYAYPGASAPALDGVDLKLTEGELVLLAGASASGKSTLLRAASGLVPHFFGGRFAGRVLVSGLDTRECGPEQIAAVAGSLFQDPESQVVMTTVRSELELPLENRGWTEASIARSVEETALALGIAGLLDRSMDTLSGGELQRVALGATLMGEPKLLLLDEPTSQLDPVAGDELIWQLRRLNEEWGVTVLLAEHRVERCLAAADRVVTLDRGRVRFDGRPTDFVDWAATEAPALAPPVSMMFARAAIRPLPIGVKDGRALLRARGLVGPDGQDEGESERQHRPAQAPAERSRRLLRSRRARSASEAALALERVWVSYDDGTGATLAALRGLSLRIGRGETVALLGRNGAGKSTLLRVAAGLRLPDRGRLRAAGDVALVLQNPGDYFLHEHVRDELPKQWADAALAEVGLSGSEDADPRDLSGGERQRLALAVVLAGRGIGGGEAPAVVALDEPTRGMDRGHKQALATRLRFLAAGGAAVIVATHDVEFAARTADRCVLLADGRVVADDRTEEVLSGGRYFATEVARVLGGGAKVVLPEEGARRLAAAIGQRGARRRACR